VGPCRLFRRRELRDQQLFLSPNASRRCVLTKNQIGGVSVKKAQVFALLVVLAMTLSGSAQEPARFNYGPGVPRFVTLQPRGVNAATAFADAAAGTTVPLFTDSVKSGGVTFRYTMVGTNPKAGSATTIVPTVIIPIAFKFSDGTLLDPTKVVCGGTKTALALTKASPVYKNHAYVLGTTDVGNTQFVDAFQRASFWKFVSTTSPNYHVLLTVKTGPKKTLNVPASAGFVVGGPCAPIGEVDIDWFDNQLTNVIFPSILAVNPTVLPQALFYNVFLTSGGCCILGYHSAFGSPAQTYSVASYSDPGIFSVPIEDVHALSHEVGEWMDDPLVNNATPPWTGGQAAGTCQANLEVGDPLTGTAFPVTLTGKTYHPQEMVFFSWFFRQKPSIGVNKWYSFNKTLTTAPPICH
jgi:hypothetical protein